MRLLFLIPMIVGTGGAFFMAFMAAGQAFGVRGLIDRSKFGLGPSWKWFAFNTLGFLWNVALVVGASHGWLTR